MLGTAAAIGAASIAVAGAAHGSEPPARDAYVAQLERICKRDRLAGERILAGAATRVRGGRLRVAGRQLLRAAQRFGTTIRQIVAVPRPPADDARLRRWFKFLRIVKRRVGRVGIYYMKQARLAATHESIRAEEAANNANNVGYPFGFRECRLRRSRFR